MALFLAFTLLRVFQPSRNAFVQVLGYASFYFSVTDVGLGLIEAFPSLVYVDGTFGYLLLCGCHG